MPRETQKQKIERLQRELKRLKKQLRQTVNAIQKHCYACCGNSITEAKRCGMKPSLNGKKLVSGCWLYPFQPKFKEKWMEVYA